MIYSLSRPRTLSVCILSLIDLREVFTTKFWCRRQNFSQFAFAFITHIFAYIADMSVVDVKIITLTIQILMARNNKGF